MLSLTRFAAIFRQHGVNFRVSFTARATYLMVPADIPEELFRSPICRALENAGASPEALSGNEGLGLYYRIESLT